MHRQDSNPVRHVHRPETGRPRGEAPTEGVQLPRLEEESGKRLAPKVRPRETSQGNFRPQHREQPGRGEGHSRAAPADKVRRYARRPASGGGASTLKEIKKLKQSEEDLKEVCLHHLKNRGRKRDS